jgi:hypothetical protein
VWACKVKIKSSFGNIVIGQLSAEEIKEDKKMGYRENGRTTKTMWYK